MTKEEIIKIIVVALIGSLSKSLFDNILGKYIPDKKRLNSYILKLLLFSLRYLLPMTVLILTFISESSIDKYFIFTVVIMFSVIVINILIDVLSYYLKAFSAINCNIIDQFEKLTDVVESMNNIEDKK